MKYTLGQVKEILPISQDTYRHWKITLPPLNGRNGHTRCFSPGDLLAMAIVKTLTEEVGIRVGNLQSVAIELFAHCDSGSWAGLERSTLVINQPPRARVTSVPESQAVTVDGIAIVLPCRPIITGLRQRLLLGRESTDQEPLRFPPTALSGGQRRQGA
jgi:DNA-binding transcriptional MerR regulator